MEDLGKIHRNLKSKVKYWREKLLNLKIQKSEVDFFDELIQLSRNVRNTQTKKSIKNLAVLEKRFLMHTNPSGEKFSEKYRNAINSGEYSNTQTYQSRQNPTTGWIYILTDPSYQEGVKIGYTKNSPSKRLQLFKHKYPEHQCAEIIHSIEVNFPKNIETLIFKKLKKHRISINTKGQSNEWFAITPKYAKRVITMAINESQ